MLAHELLNTLRLHIEHCPGCAAEEVLERRLKRELASLRGEFPHTIDIRRRVMREISSIGRVEREVVPARQIGWAAAAAIACGLGLLGSLAWFWPDVAPLLAELEVMAGTFGRIVADVAAPLITLLSLPFKLAGVLLKSLAGYASVLSRLEPAAIGAITICYMGMAVLITLIVGRDFRKPSLALPEKEE
jgi:hypothetical protein